MSSLNTFKITKWQNEVRLRKSFLPLCNSRCRNCQLFPFDKLTKSNVSKGNEFGTFIIKGEQKKFSSQGIRLFCALARQNNTVLPQDYLIKYTWPESTIVRNNLNVAIYDLRILLIGTSITIENHRKEGYSLTL
ncbi:hypothetical protein tloyanaT_00150 [Thalassotalea loyana]|uniref:OmpR/PhoB-type domain-containing protein n=1 Tax=Thalassotalea loyana TaxID=280483 RepID=A0ABQ6H6I4_9GAMM|nr:winged helix-turn-helix domain-containing protein [Thalassotalea loyana]GLX83763.1 hypothetical protein tloyanaT_00150 [Thalassotalea loyana]